VRRGTAWVFVPVLGAPLLHAPVLRWNLFASLARPISRRAFGANKTWRGALFMTAGPLAATVVAHRVPAYRRHLPPQVAAADPRVVGARLGLALWTGELPNSFIKRRLGIAPGSQRRSASGVLISIVDQADWVPAAALLLRPVYAMPPREVAAIAGLVGAIHLPVNLIGYAIGARSSPL
jgi:hypothetical protein